MEENNFLPYETRKKRENSKNMIVNLIIIILLLVNIVWLVKLYFNILDYRNKTILKEAAAFSLQSKIKDNKVKFKESDTLRLILNKVENENYTHIAIKGNSVELEFSCIEDLRKCVKNIESDSKLTINSLVKVKDSDKYSMIVEVKNN